MAGRLPPDKREAERVPILGQLQAEMLVFQPMAVREISRAGLTVQTAFPIQLDSLHDLRLMLAGRPVVVKARVVHSRVSDMDRDEVTYRSGLEFVDVSDRIVEAIGAYLDSLKADRTGV